MQEILELKSEEKWLNVFPILQSLRPNLTLEFFLNGRESLVSRDYHLLGLKSQGEVVCVAGYVLHPHVEQGTEFWLHDFATLPEERSKGYGLNMLVFLEKLAAEKGCKRILLHTRVERFRAQQFYSKRANYQEYALVYRKELNNT